MKNDYIIYQDTVSRVTNDTFQVVQIDTSKKIDNATISLKSNDTIKAEENNVQPIPKTEPLIKRPEKIDKTNEQKLVLQDSHVLDKEKESTKIQIETNFLKKINNKDVEIKPNNVFQNQVALKQLIPNEKIRREQILITSDWILPIVLISLGIMIWVRKAYYRQIELLFSSINNYQMSMKLYKDPSSRFRHLSFILNVNAALTVGLFLYQLAGYFHAKFFDGNPFFNYMIIITFLLVIYVIQFIGYFVLGNILDSKKEYFEFLHHTYTFIKVLGIIFIPFAIIITYATDKVMPYLLIVGVIIIIFFYFKRLQRGIRILMQKQFLKLHQILYFCTLEILPVMVIFKYVNSLIERSF